MGGQLPDAWSGLRPLQTISGFDQGEGLAIEITSTSRTIPIVVVSELAGRDLALPKLDERLAYDLAVLANVVRIDGDASWGLTDQLGDRFPCFGGALRIYWPGVRGDDDRYRHPLWTPERLRESGDDPKDVLERLRRQLRGLLMRAAALSTVRPRAIDAIRSAASRRAFEEMKARATSAADFQAIAESYANENDKLRASGQKLNDQIEALKAEVAALELRAKNAELLVQFREPAKSGDIIPDPGPPPAVSHAPQPDEVRFYKKVHDTGSHDIMRRARDCGCGNWKTAHQAPKAEKGVAKLEGGRSDWKSFQKCASCTGGGMWKVRW